MRGQDRPAAVRAVRGRRHDPRAERLHEDPAVRLLVVRGPHHVDVALESEEAARHRHGRAPLAGARLGGDPADARLLVVVGLRHGGVRLVGPGGAHALVLEVDVGGGLQRLLQPGGAEQRRGPPQAVDVEHGPGDVDPRVGGDLLQDQRLGEQRRQVGRSDGLLRLRAQGRQRGHARLHHVRHDVEPRGRQIPRLKVEAGACLAHGGPPEDEPEKKRLWPASVADPGRDAPPDRAREPMLPQRTSTQPGVPPTDDLRRIDASSMVHRFHRSDRRSVRRRLARDAGDRGARHTVAPAVRRSAERHAQPLRQRAGGPRHRRVHRGHARHVPDRRHAGRLLGPPSRRRRSCRRDRVRRPSPSPMVWCGTGPASPGS